MTTGPTRRFSNRARDYAQFRPGYPAEIIQILERECRLRASSVVVDAGCGTGIFTEILLHHGCRVFAVEPNDAMRREAESKCSKYAKFTSVAAPAESTGLPDASADLATFAQSFHWFDVERARAEFLRLLRPPAPVCIVSNERRRTGDAFHERFESLMIEFGTDYLQVIDALKRESLNLFFGVDNITKSVLPNKQQLDRAGLRGRVLSASFMPAEGQPRHEELLRALDAAFEKYERDGVVTIEYETVAFTGNLRPK
ncbi:MAG: class I SAM-dependent methyltransferase [Planctomycetes bacterium]|nr:class I SAM-dependent methyltransferase [Planctomycetota bacterium]